MKERIKEIRKDSGLNQTEFGERIGVRQTTVAGYENGNRAPLDAIISSICREFGVNEKWLRTGSGEKYNKVNKQVLAYVTKLAKGIEKDDFIMALLETYMELDQSSKDALRETAKAFANKYK